MKFTVIGKEWKESYNEIVREKKDVITRSYLYKYKTKRLHETTKTLNKK